MIPGLQFVADPPKAIKARLVAEAAHPDHSGKDELEVQFNPESISLKRSVDWTETDARGAAFPSHVFLGGKPDTIDFELLFDTTLPGEDVDVLESLANQALMMSPIPGVAPGGAINRLLSKGPDSVLTPINTLISWTHPYLPHADDANALRPPGVVFGWGPDGDDKRFEFAGVIAALSIDLKAFFRDGRPVRALVSVTMEGRYLGAKASETTLADGWKALFVPPSKAPKKTTSTALTSSRDSAKPPLFSL